MSSQENPPRTKEQGEEQKPTIILREQVGTGPRTEKEEEKMRAYMNDTKDKFDVVIGQAAELQAAAKEEGGLGDQHDDISNNTVDLAPKLKESAEKEESHDKQVSEPNPGNKKSFTLEVGRKIEELSDADLGMRILKQNPSMKFRELQSFANEIRAGRVDIENLGSYGITSISQAEFPSAGPPVSPEKIEALQQSLKNGVEGHKVDQEPSKEKIPTITELRNIEIQKQTAYDRTLMEYYSQTGGDGLFAKMKRFLNKSDAVEKSKLDEAYKALQKAKNVRQGFVLNWIATRNKGESKFNTPENLIAVLRAYHTKTDTPDPSTETEDTQKPESITERAWDFSKKATLWYSSIDTKKRVAVTAAVMSGVAVVGVAGAGAGALTMALVFGGTATTQVARATAGFLWGKASTSALAQVEKNKTKKTRDQYFEELKEKMDATNIDSQQITTLRALIGKEHSVLKQREKLFLAGRVFACSAGVLLGGRAFDGAIDVLGDMESINSTNLSKVAIVGGGEVDPTAVVSGPDVNLAQASPMHEVSIPDTPDMRPIPEPGVVSNAPTMPQYFSEPLGHYTIMPNDSIYNIVLEKVISVSPEMSHLSPLEQQNLAMNFIDKLRANEGAWSLALTGSENPDIIMSGEGVQLDSWKQLMMQDGVWSLDRVGDNMGEFTNMLEAADALDPSTNPAFEVPSNIDNTDYRQGEVFGEGQENSASTSTIPEGYVVDLGPDVEKWAPSVPNQTTELAPTVQIEGYVSELKGNPDWTQLAKVLDRGIRVPYEQVSELIDGVGGRLHQVIDSFRQQYNSPLFVESIISDDNAQFTVRFNTDQAGNGMQFDLNTTKGTMSLTPTPKTFWQRLFGS